MCPSSWTGTTCSATASRRRRECLLRPHPRRRLDSAQAHPPTPQPPADPAPARDYPCRGRRSLSLDRRSCWSAPCPVLGIALATGAPLQSGLVAAAVGGIVAARLGGSPLQVSGPAAGLTVVTAELIHRYGWRATCAITVLAGVAQLGLGCLRVARTALRVSPAIVRAGAARRHRCDHRRRPDCRESSSAAPHRAPCSTTCARYPPSWCTFTPRRSR